MSTNILDYLSAQHVVFLEQLLFLEKLKDLQKSDTVSGLKEVVFTIAKAVEKHAEVEEKYFFPELIPYVTKETGPLHVIEFEHTDIRKILKRLKNAKDAHTTRIEAAKFIAFLRDHIAKEEIVLFPLAKERLGEVRLEIMGKK